MQPNVGFGHLDSLVDEIQKKQSDHVKLESQLRQERRRAESEAADASRLKSDLEAAAAENLALQESIGLLSRKNEDLAGENAKLLEEKCDFQRSMANNEAKLRENETDLRDARKKFVDELDKANAAYSRHRAMMNTISGHTGPGCAEIPSPEELDTLKAAAAKAQEAELRAAEIEARMHAVEAESQALKGEAAENFQKQQSLRNELATVKDVLKRDGGKKNSGAQAIGTTQQQQELREHLSKLEREVARLNGVCTRKDTYTKKLEEYTDTVEEGNVILRQKLEEHGIPIASDRGGGGAAADRSIGGQDLSQQFARKENGAAGLMSAPSQGGSGRGRE